MTLKLVVSGAQVGADIAGLRAATACGIQTGGWMPKGFRTTLGPLDSALVELYNLQETESEGYPQRTQKNVQVADGTIQFAYNWNSPGEKLTTRLVKEAGQPNYQVSLLLNLDECRVDTNPTDLFTATDITKEVTTWIKENNIEILNVAGNGNTAIEDTVEKFLGQVFQQLQQGPP